MKLFAAVMPLFVVGISMVHYHPEMDGFAQISHESPEYLHYECR